MISKVLSLGRGSSFKRSIIMCKRKRHGKSSRSEVSLDRSKEGRHLQMAVICLSSGSQIFLERPVRGRLGSLTVTVSDHGTVRQDQAKVLRSLISVSIISCSVGLVWMSGFFTGGRSR